MEGPHASFQISRPKKKTNKDELEQLIQPRHKLRWLYLSQVVPSSVLETTSPFVLKAAVDGAYRLTGPEKEEFENFAAYVADLPDLILSRLGKDNSFVKIIRNVRKQAYVQRQE